MKVGDYVRTKYGIEKIKRIIPNAYDKEHDYVELVDCVFDGLDIQGFFTTDEIIKSSQNIIDLIEVGDYVNGEKIIEISESGKVLFYWDYDRLRSIENGSIKSTVTKEQFESMEYKIN